jgi:DtxR family Mn-dependent transcriptional regulator
LTLDGKRLAERTETSRRVLALFLREILGVDEGVAIEDACMIEHLVSPEVSLELLRLTSFMRSEHPAAKEFREFYRGSPRTCAEHAPSACDVCGATCMRESLERERAESEASV